MVSKKTHFSTTYSTISHKDRALLYEMIEKERLQQEKKPIPENSDKEIHFRLKNTDDMDKFTKTLFENKIPHSFCGNGIFCTDRENKEKLEQLGYEFENARVINLSDLSLEERVNLKRKSHDKWFETREASIKKLLYEYGILSQKHIKSKIIIRQSLNYL
ncbi:MAG: hypothetical protein H7844_02725 [Nitrospirae bacterium YQR-1]